MAKKFPIRERLGLTYRAEFFNFLNHTNLTTVQTAMSSGQFGTVTAAAAARVIQMTLRLDF